MRGIDLGVIDSFNQITALDVALFMVFWFVVAIIIAEWRK